MYPIAGGFDVEQLDAAAQRLHLLREVSHQGDGSIGILAQCREQGSFGIKDHGRWCPRWFKLEWPTRRRSTRGRAFHLGPATPPQYGEEYFKQLTAERLVTRIVKGFPRGSWEKEPGRCNEALDCRVYAPAAAGIYGLDRFDERHWRRIEEALARTGECHHDEPSRQRPLPVRPPARRVIHRGYVAS